MTGNHKLSALLRGRVVSGITRESAQTAISFTDGSTLTVQTAGTVPPAPPGAVVHAVREADTTLILDFEGGTHWQITTAGATSSVMLRDHLHVIEYAD